ncbi:hypothetical protein D3C71_1742280 [compost metagenome]
MKISGIRLRQQVEEQNRKRNEEDQKEIQIPDASHHVTKLRCGILCHNACMVIQLKRFIDRIGDRAREQHA